MEEKMANKNNYDDLKAKKQSKTINTDALSKITKNLNTKQGKKAVKTASGIAKVNGVAVLLIVGILILGLVAGYFCCTYFTKNDIFAMNTYGNGSTDAYYYMGNVEGMSAEEIEQLKKEYVNDDEFLILGDYDELGVKLVAFGTEYTAQDYTVKYYFKSDLTTPEEAVQKIGDRGAGMYYAIYTTNVSRYQGVTLIRNIIVFRGEEDDNE